jgi:hypothetical protein
MKYKYTEHALETRLDLFSAGNAKNHAYYTRMQLISNMDIYILMDICIYITYIYMRHCGSKPAKLSAYF